MDENYNIKSLLDNYSFLANENMYFFELNKYMRYHTNNTEVNFLTELKKTIEEEITSRDEKKKTLDDATDEQIFKVLLKSKKPKFINENNFNDWIEIEKTRLNALFETCKLKTSLKLINIRLDRLPKIKTSKSNLIFGKKLNISERYKIANEIFNLESIIQRKNISATEKHKLLALIMGCNQQTARELFNGTQIKRTPIRENIVNKYLNSLD